MKAAKKFVLIAALILSFTASLTRAAEPAVLKQVPSDAEIVVIVPNIGDASAKISQIAKSLGINQPMLENPLQTFQESMNLQKGLDEKGGFAVAMSKLPLPGTANETGEPDALMVLPVKDYTAFIDNFGVKPAAGDGVTEVEFQGSPGFVRKVGSYAIFSNKKESVQNYKTPLTSDIVAKAGALGASVINSNDVIVYVNLAKLGPIVQPFVQIGLNQLKSQLALQPGMESMAGIFDIYGSAINALLRDGQAMVLGLDASTEGFGLTYAAQFKDGSAIASSLAKGPAAELRFNRLPNKPFLAVTATDFGNLPIKQWITDLKGLFPADDAFGKLMASSLDTYGAYTQGQSIILPPNLTGGAPSLYNAINIYPVKDPKAALAINRKLVESLNNVELMPGMAYKTDYKANVMQVEGFSVDQFLIQVTFPQEVTAAMGPLAGLFAQPMSSYVIAAKDSLIMTTGADPTTLKDVILAANGGGDLEANKSIAAIRAKLPPGRIMETYIGVGTLINSINTFTQLFAPNLKLNAPADLPPVAMSFSTDKGGAAMKIYVPMPVVTAVRDIIMNVMGEFSADSGAPEPETPFEESKLVPAVTDADFQAQVLQSDKLVLVDFWATWCGPCKVQAPIVNQLAEQYQGKVKFAKLDIDKNAKTTDLYEVESIPTLLLIKDGKVVAKFVGVTPKEQLEAAIKKAAGL